ncbi:MAG: ABC transporter substrate-binding protein [Acidiferrobacterales bacterium]|nr:ABC transporter substrate-binding protein [Acidiferrobacterales bacterium]
MLKSFRLILFSLLMLSGVTAFAAKSGITIGMQLEPPNLDPTGGAAAAIDEVVYANIFEGLTRFASDGSIQPALAKGWSVENEGKKYVFQLQENVQFHDGTAFTADDVKFSIERAQAEESTNAQKGLFENIAGVEVLDDSTVVVNLTNPDGNLPFNLAWGDAIIVAVESIENAKTAPVGTGPFVFNNWVQGDRINLKRNENYWGEPAKLESVTFKFISEPTAAFAAMMAGDVDAFPVYPAPENLPQLEADPRFSVVLGSTEGETILSINNKSEKLSDRKVRKAIAHAIDRSALIEGAMFGYGTPIGTHFAPHHPAYVDLTANSNYDPELSKSLLKEAGVGNLELSLKLPPPAYARRGGEIIASQLRSVGIETKIENLEWAQWLEQVFKGKDFDLTIVSHTEPMDIGIYVKPDYYFQYENAELQGVMETLKSESDDEKRTELLQQAQNIIANDYVNGFLFQLAKTGVANSKIQGLWENAPTQANDLTAVFWAE